MITMVMTHWHNTQFVEHQSCKVYHRVCSTLMQGRACYNDLKRNTTTFSSWTTHLIFINTCNIFPYFSNSHPGNSTSCFLRQWTHCSHVTHKHMFSPLRVRYSRFPTCRWQWLPARTLGLRLITRDEPRCVAAWPHRHLPQADGSS